MPPLNLPFTVFGRPAKPVSFFFMCAMAVVAYLNFAHEGIIEPPLPAHVVGTAAGLASLLALWGWIRQSQHISEWALLLTSFVWAARFWAGGLTYGVTDGEWWKGFSLGNEGVWLSLCWSGLAAGSFWLEKVDANRRRRGGTVVAEG